MHSSAKKIQKVLSSGEIRKTFIDYFSVNHDHKFVRSSPVVPFCDPTVAFVNAGMNQFKSIFLGKTKPIHRRVCNSQKCVRVGGKHNDLSVVGQDGYHHTFFEMLGNWSFGDYFKREACEMALELLRGPLRINPERLYVTYFAGDKLLDIPPDLECFNIWRSLGFPASRILPFGCAENFWEMGPTGPCGPCTEIHIDNHPHLAGSIERANLVNAGSSDMMELWNLVFIQYHRNADGTISELPDHHVDTGMGFERLTTIMQNKFSNYDTDLFTPIFDYIKKVTSAPQYGGKFPTAMESCELDTGYRILADHARMITTCLADGMLPDKNQKLRRVLRKSLTISENVFANENLLSQLIPVVVETFGTAYPELCSKKNSIFDIISYEQEIFKELRASSTKAFTDVRAEFPKLEYIDLIECPGFIMSYRDFRAQKWRFQNNTIPGDFLFKLTDTYGLTEQNLQKLAEAEKMLLDMQGYKRAIANAKAKSKVIWSSLANEVDHCQQQKAEDALTSLTKKLPPTDNSHKYRYKYNADTKQYIIPNVSAKVLCFLQNNINVGVLKREVIISSSDTIYIVTDCSNFYYKSGGQQSDQGKMFLRAANKTMHKLDVIDVKLMNECLVHVCKSLGDFNLILSNDTDVLLIVDAEHRKLNTCHHTGTHLLNEAIRSLYNKITYQVSSEITKDFLKLELGLLGKRIHIEDVENIEDLIQKVIKSCTPVDVQLITASDVIQQGDITIIPGETYPETNLRLLTVINDKLQFRSKELCCGTHVLNTKEIEYFCIINVKQSNRARYTFTAVAGPVAKHVLKTAGIIDHRVDNLECQFKDDNLTNVTEQDLQKIRNTILSDIMLPFAFKTRTLERVNKMYIKLKESTRTTLREFVEYEMKNVLDEKPFDKNPFILHYIKSSALVEEVPLQKATKLCKDRPIMVVGLSNGVVKARCFVPKEYVSDKFNAELWLNILASVFKTKVLPPKGQNAREVCNMKGKKVSTNFEEQLDIAMQKANKFAEMHLL